ncbi:MAG: HD domain-containing protein [Turicibacter sp.]|uniref:HD domain-containing protein n=1 Tax=Turicibacter sp. T129 TaxID=2951141 RepID=UPI0009EC665C|nr:HD domain-containing protein [Turicibacter sp. T129]MCU7194314.1 HD domain-containing protein [Turicibacter sp. T129]MEE0428605.1 HD domain-containing protein [Turicibacter sp.]
MTKLEEKVFRDPVYGYVHVYDQLIWDLIQTKEVQRLRRIKQLGGTYMVFHTAEHSRFSHSLGVYEMARKIIRALMHRGTILSEDERLLVLSAALLHDLGHGPFSHSFESVFSVRHELFTERIIMENTEVNRVLEAYQKGFATKVRDVINKTYPNPLIISIISSQLDADRLDYLLRDAYFTGAPYGEIDVERILRTMRVVNNKIVYKVSGMHAIEDYLMSRYQMYWQVYLHSTGRSFDLVIQNMLRRVRELIFSGYEFKRPLEALKDLFLEEEPSVETYLKFDDSTISYYASLFTDEEDEILRDFADRFINRRLLKEVHYTPNDETNEKLKQVKEYMIELGINPDYYLLTDHSVKTPYDYYGHKTNCLPDCIELLMRDGSIQEISEVSTIIKGIIAVKPKQEHKVYFPLDLIRLSQDGEAKQRILELLHENVQ